MPQGLRTGEVGRIVRVANGELLSPREALAELSTVSVVYVSERHDVRAHHDVQLLIAKGLVAKGVLPVLGLEMFEQKHQPALDAYLSGASNEEEFLSEVAWKTSWGFPYALYRPILEFAKAQGLRVLAINADRDLVRAVGKHGKDKLPAPWAERCPPLSSGNPAHKEYIRGFWKHHGTAHKGGDFEKFYQAQLVWDETMAKALRTAQASLATGEMLLVFAGSAHVKHAHGIPMRASVEGGDFSIVVPIEHGKLLNLHNRLRSISYPKKIADILWESGPPLEGSAPPKPERTQHAH
jgi:aminopeptidase N